ncbi:MAG: hypothetical protein HY597_01390, partial [Candidatus Omnitrophica bacterium]|nr:hypothetical protein [Candidatus Omnitrophota bacterium]
LEEQEQALAKSKEERQAKGAKTSAESKQLAAKLKTLADRERQLAEQRQALEAQRAELLQAQQRMAQADTSRETQSRTYLQQLEEQRQVMAKHREQLETQLRQFEEERKAFEEERRQFEVERQKLQEQSLTATTTASTAQHQLDDFSTETLTLMANELDGPLTALQQWLTLLMQGDLGALTPKAREALAEMTKVHDQLGGMVRESLDAARLDHGQVRVEMRPVPLQEILTHVVEQVKASVEAKHLALHIKPNGSTAVSVLTDPARAEEVLLQLLRNAVQYTDTGTISVAASLKGERAVITITDTGIGIAPERQAHLFSKPVLGTILHGHGLGLYLAQHLAKQLQGEVALVDSEPSKGSTFAVTLPKAGA